ncbi:MAG: hypothetical protein ABS79_05705, partial [Planctomycetes bacterium SCN 63-9]
NAPKKPNSEISDAELLFRESAAPAKQPNDLGKLPASESPEVFDLGERAETRSPSPRPPAAMMESAPSPRTSSTPPPPSESISRPGIPETERDREFRAASKSAFETTGKVDQIWSRKNEWGPSLIALACWTIALLSLLYIALVSELFNMALVLLILGGLYWLYLCYPILITLEIPVRLTPESAVKDYYAALSHHMPHYRRMWLLLSRQARLTTNYGSYEGFRDYWKGRVAELKRGAGARPSTPLLFQVDSFHAEKNLDKSEANARFVLNIFVRGRREEGPIASVPMQIDLVRGPDKMFYLCDGDFPKFGLD